MSRYLIVVIVAIVAYASQINSQATQPGKHFLILTN
jgi:hypothetical protein